MESPPLPILERQLSIENEPKTLFHGDVNSAREAALKVLKMNTEEDALSIFLEGLKPVKIGVKPEWDQSEDVDGEECKEK